MIAKQPKTLDECRDYLYDIIEQYDKDKSRDRLFLHLGLYTGIVVQLTEDRIHITPDSFQGTPLPNFPSENGE